MAVSVPHCCYSLSSLSLIATSHPIPLRLRPGLYNPIIVGQRTLTQASLAFCYSESTPGYSTSEEEEYFAPSSLTPTASSTSTSAQSTQPPPMLKKRKRYRKAYPGENKGITEEMRFVAMKLRNSKAPVPDGHNDGREEGEVEGRNVSEESDSDSEAYSATWEPTIEGFLKYLADIKLVFQTLENIVEESSDISYTYFRRTGLERSAALSNDLEWFSQQNIEIPEPSSPGLAYAAYLEELALRSAPLFLSHFYNVYLTHLTGGQVIAKQVSEKILEGRDLEFCSWEGDPQLLLKDMRDKLNQLGEHWSRDDKNKCLKESTKAFRYLGQIVRLIIL